MCFKQTILTVLLLIMATRAQLRSPCPKVLTYDQNNNESNRWDASITLQSNYALEGVFVRILLDHPVEILGNWFGDSTQRGENNQDYLIRNPSYTLEAGPPVLLKFFVKWQTNEPTPSVKKILLNGIIICEVGGGRVEATTPKLFISRPKPPRDGSLPLAVQQTTDRQTTYRYDDSSSVTKPNGLSYNTGSSNNQNEFFLGDFNLNRRPNRTKPKPKCGNVAINAKPLISSGQSTIPGQWPWHVALYNTLKADFSYTCGGTLISDSHVITAAHCVTKPQTNRPISEKVLSAYLGKYSLKRFGQGIQDSDINRIFVHPKYNSSIFFNDLAILKLETPIQLTNYVRPCCLWQEADRSLQGLASERLGTVVGWGYDANGHISDDLMQLQMPIVPTLECIYSNRNFFAQFTFEKNYCAGNRNGSSVCNGDSGGGMVFPVVGTTGEDTVWQLRGIVSISVALQGEVACDTSHYTVFTDVAQHLDWIQQILNDN